MFQDRLKELRMKVAKSAKQFAEDNAIDARTYNNYETGERNPGLGFLQQLSLKYGINLNWLILGIGSKTIEETNGDCFPIPVRKSVEASCGFGVEIYDESKTYTYSLSRKLLLDLGANFQSSEIIFARGDSMAPTIEAGDCLLIDTSKTEVYDGSLYCINLNGQLYAKRLHKVSSCAIDIISDNAKYDKIRVDLASEANILNVIGEIKWIGRIAK